MIGRPAGRRLAPALVVAALLWPACAADTPGCDLEPTSAPVALREASVVEVAVPEALLDLGGDGVYAGPQLEPLDHGGVIWQSPEIVADSFMRRPAFLTVASSEAVATMIDPETLQLVMIDGAVLTLRPVDCT